MKRTLQQIVAAFLLMTGPLSWGAAISSVPGTGLDWKLTSTWVGGVVPGSGDTVTIVTGSGVIVTDTEAASTLTTAGTGCVDVQSGGKLTTTTTYTTVGTGGCLVEGDLEVGTIFTGGTGTSLTASGKFKYGDGSATPTDEFLLNGTFNFTCNGCQVLAENNALQQKGSQANFYAGTLMFLPNGGGSGTVTYVWRQSSSGSGSPIQRYCLDSTCSDGLPTLNWVPQVVTCNATTAGQTFNGFTCPASSSTGAGQFGSGGGGDPWNLIAHHAIWNYLGSASVQAVNGSFITNTLSGDYFDISGLLVENSGELLESGTVAQLNHITGLVLANPVDTANSHRAAAFNNSAGWSTGSTFHDNYLMVSPYKTSTTMWSVQFNVKGFSGGSAIACGDAADVPVFETFNGIFDISGTNGQNMTIKNFMGVAETNNTSTTSRSVITGSGGNGTTDCMMFGAVKLNDGWPILFNLAGGAGGTNTHQYSMVDGFTYQLPSDSADAIWDSATNSWEQFMVWNGGGTADCLDSSAACTFTNGLYKDSWQMKMSHGGSYPNAIKGVFGNAFLGGAGNTAATSSLTDQGWWFDDPSNGVAQNVTNGVNNNLIWRQQGSGDPGALAHLSGAYPLMINAALGGIASWVQPGLRVIATKAGVSAFTTTNVSNDTFNGATGLFTGTQAGDEVCDSTQKNLTCQTILTPISSSSAVMDRNPGWATTDTFTTRPGTLAAQVYGTTSGAGNKDYHFDPQPVDQDRNACSFNVLNGGVGIGSSNGCNYPYQTYATSIQASYPCTVSGNSVTLVGTTLTTWGIGSSDYIKGTLAANDVGFAPIASVGSQTTLTTSSNIGNTATYCTLVTDIDSLGKRMMAQSGWTLNSAGAVIPVTATTGYKASDLFKYMITGFHFASFAACSDYNGGPVGPDLFCGNPAMLGTQ